MWENCISTIYTDIFLVVFPPTMQYNNCVPSTDIAR
jgi:hypothetical protein